MTGATASNLAATLERVARRSAAAVVARARAASPGFNAALLRRLAAAPGSRESLLAEPVFEVARNWTIAKASLGDLAGDLLHPDLVAALDQPGAFHWERDRAPYVHQLDAWTATLREGASCLVTAGTGAGKTECFLIPLLDDLLRNPRRGGGVQAILLYPLNALIESQRERLAAWAEGLGGRVRFALFNGDTPETARRAGEHSTRVELKCRKDIRERPPEILLTNVTMLEYLLLRPADAPIIAASQGALRWLVLDEAHTFAGAQAAEIALLLRRVRAAFGVAPEQVRLVATSATIGGEADVPEKLRDFLAALAGQPAERVRVIEGRAAEPRLPTAGAGVPLDAGELAGLDEGVLWKRLASHPRLQELRRAMSARAVGLSQTAQALFGDPQRHRDAQSLLDAAARAAGPEGHLLAWRAHLFHRPLGGIWACVDPACAARDPELDAAGSDWRFGAIHLGVRERCGCGAPAFEVVLCGACGKPHLAARQIAGAEPRLEAPSEVEGDDFALDAEPDEGEAGEITESGAVWLAPARGEVGDPWITRADARIWDNAPPEGAHAIRVRIIERAEGRDCCGEAASAPLAPLRYGPAFFIGNGLPLVLEALEPSAGGLDLPMAGRRALTFSDSRQGVARLAAKLQQDAERTLTRSFLYHAVQERSDADPAEIAKVESRLERLRKDPDGFADMIREHEQKLAALTGAEARLVTWPELRRRFAQQAELRDFAGDVWQARLIGGSLAEDPERLAEMFLFRELFRRPRVQNNPETMGLLRLAFPTLEARAKLGAVPLALAAAGVDMAGWTGLALAAIDFVFRISLAVDLPDSRLVRLISPRFGGHRGIVVHDSTTGTENEGRVRRFPGPMPGARPAALHRMVYGLLGGHWDDRADRDRAAEVLEALWQLITSTAARDVGRGVWRIDFEQAAVVRLDHGFVCPIIRRLFGYAVAGRSPYQVTPETHLADTPAMETVSLPRLPRANAGGLDEAGRAQVARWCENSAEVAALRRSGLWTDLHDRIAAYAPFLRAQEHSAQIERAVLNRYVELFKEGRINLLNCSTTMEMGVDIPQVRLVVNANVPPAIANYRQRSGRAGRRSEPWAFTLTFARDLPLDRSAAADPAGYLAHPIAAPKVWLESAPLVQRHANAALLAAFLRGRGGQPIKGSIGAFLAAGETAEAAVLPDAPADAFLDMLLQEPPPELTAALDTLTQGTALAGNVARLLSAAAHAFEDLLRLWRAEYRQLLERAETLDDKDARRSMQLRAARMRGEFLIAELARRGFTPSYGFPTDVVSFDYMSGRRETGDGVLSFGDLRGAASRTRDVAIREYAPGAELVIDGLVYRSDGVRPAWGSDADASRLEDLRDLWSCPACGSFGLARLPPEHCPRCDAERIEHARALIPVGFLSRTSAHTGYEALAYVPFEMPRIAADGAAWTALPDAAAGRLRCDPEGHVIVTGGGAEGQGYAICLACGRAEPEAAADGVAPSPLPDAIHRHRPLMLGKGIDRTRDGFCPGGYMQPQRVQRLVRLVHDARTDVFELQLAATVTPEAGLALAAGLREALAERLGVEAREIGLATGRSRGLSGEACCSVFLFDRATGGAGYVTRLAELDDFAATVVQAAKWLDCPETCIGGCAACVLRPDLNVRGLRLDRRGGQAAAEALRQALVLPEAVRVLGPQTRPLGKPTTDWLVSGLRTGQLRRVAVFLHGDAAQWEMQGWPLSALLPRLVEAGVETTLVLPASMFASPEFGLPARLALHRLAASRVLLATLPTLPEVAGRPVIATVERATETLAIATDPAEAGPGPNWGAGALAPVVAGPWGGVTQIRPMDAEALLRDALGGARLLWVGAALDGPLKSFGTRFWRLIQREAPAAYGALASASVTNISYSDRYLLTPLNLVLLREVLMGTPGGSGANIHVALAPAERSTRFPYAIYDAYVEDAVRRDVLRRLLPSARVTLTGRKADLPHHRRLDFELQNGRHLTMVLDQGFGAWRTQSDVRHNFTAAADAQARSITSLNPPLRAAEARGTPLTIEVT
ncbi:MAG TPA: DEAD/DEAH box helicase [Stellaceae bacterium]|nr:DEAD/DEAH box helicase [Stellaceae bacterium]